MKQYPLIILVAFFALAGCSPSRYQAGKIAYNKYDIKPAQQSDSSLQKMLAPYSTEINKTMNLVIGRLDQTLEKKQPDNTLGFFMCDALLSSSSKAFNRPVDIAMVNYGGIRINSMQAGNITTGKIYELMPFDNILVLMELDGKQLQQLMSHIAGRGGWPISGGTYTIKDKKATNILVAGAPLQDQKKYVVALSDYVANGGDDCTMLTKLPQINKGYLQRDAIIDYVKNETAASRTISVPAGARVIIEQ